MAEPSATKGTEETGTDALATEARFEHAPPAASSSEVAEEPPAPVEPVAAAAGLAGLADKGPPAAAPEWPVAWLRLVEPEPPMPADEAVAAVIAAEAADADTVAHAFGQVMAAALDPDFGAEPEPEADPALEPEAQAEADEPGADASAAVEPSEAAAPADPHGLHTVGFSALAMEAEPPEAAPEPAAKPTPTPKPEAPRGAGRFEPRSYIGRRTRSGRETPERQIGEAVPAMAVYLLYIASFVVAPALLGLGIALKARREAPEWLESHYVYQVRTFWIGLCAATISTALLLSGVLTLPGLVLGLLLIVWIVARSAIGFICVVKLQPYPRPRAWLI